MKLTRVSMLFCMFRLRLNCRYWVTSSQPLTWKVIGQQPLMLKQCSSSLDILPVQNDSHCRNVSILQISDGIWWIWKYTLFQAVNHYCLSNIMEVTKIPLSYEYLRCCHTSGTIAFGIPTTVIWMPSSLANMPKLSYLNMLCINQKTCMTGIAGDLNIR